ncbi:MAG: PD-(D/E)XK nuclease-like domain-containing protein [Patescibacteria group bacterium]|nr:PD-(D/E)XK nuclease-like domain-containing protein [Patescibacteria group bacterium]
MEMLDDVHPMPSPEPPVDLKGIVPPDCYVSPGIYVNMPEERYHHAFALSASGIKWLKVSTLDFWTRSSLNPNLDAVIEEEGYSDAKSLGSAIHKRILEGREAFDQCYIPPLSRKDFPDALDTMEEIREAIRSANESRDKEARIKLSGTKDEIIERLISAVPQTKFWDAIQSEYGQKHSGKEFLSERDIGRIEIMVRMIEAKEDIAQTFKNGLPEVSVFFICQRTGVPCKLRMDYLRPDYIGELKSFANKRRRDIDAAINSEFSFNNYAIQAAWYLDAMPYVKALAKSGRVYGDVDPEFVKRLTQRQPRKIEYVWVQKGVAPVARGKTFDPVKGGDEMGTYALAKARNESMKDKFRECLESYPPGAPWVDRVGKSLFLDEEIPGDAIG